MLRSKFKYVTANGIDLLGQFLTYDPEKRITAEKALQHPYFSENPPPQHPDLFPSWPSKASKERAGAMVSPKAFVKLALLAVSSTIDLLDLNVL
ncbi:hypothetical protein BDF19DRAFT_426504 [Syncephalis fuscata]|nr:hypothetical protein BDF19DRAFT_426504 [Syncephalis fuscata]